MRTQAPKTHVWNRFIADHDKFEVLLGKLLAASETEPREDVERIWNTLESALVDHLDEEEKNMFPTIERVAAREAVVLHEAHRHIRKRLRELGGSLFEHVVRRNLVRDFIEELRAHAAHEKRMLDLWTN